MDGSIRLDLGCGHFRQQGWIAVDFVDAHSANNPNIRPLDVESDLRSLPLPDNYADCARAIHVIEHLWPWEAADAVKEWVRVLKPGAELAIECPGLEKIIKLMDVPQVAPNYTYWGLYGDPRHERPEMMHRWAYTTLTLTRLMTQAGLVELRPEHPKFHFPIRDIRVVGKKPQPNGPRLVVPGKD